MQTTIKVHGLTLVELVVTIAIISITANILTTATTSLINSNTKRVARENLLLAFRFARSSAVNHGHPFTACTLTTSKACANQWGETVTVFSDHNGNSALDGKDMVVKTIEIPISGWRQKALPSSRAYFRWNPLGLSDGTPGSVSFCRPGTYRDEFALIVSFAGRVRTSRDFDGDGIEERSRGTPINC